MHKLLTRSVGGAIGLMLALGGASAGPAGKKIAYFDSGPNLPYIAAQNKAFVARAKELGMEVTQFDTPFDQAIQSQQIDDAIARKFDLLAVMAASQSGVLPTLIRAKKAGIPVVITNNGIKDGVEDLYVTEVGDDNVALGRIGAEHVLQALKESGRDAAKIALITGTLAEGTAKTRLEAFNSALKNHPAAKVVATEDAYWDPAKSETIAGQLLARFAPQGGLDVMIGWNDYQVAAIIRAAEAAHVQLGTGKGQIIAIGLNCTPVTVAAIKSGKEYATGTQSPVKLGTKAVDLIADYFNGKHLEKHIRLDVYPVDKHSVDTWAGDCTY